VLAAPASTPPNLRRDAASTPPIGAFTPLGYSLGGSVALHAAALDPRASAVAAFAAFTPMRTDLVTRPSGGLRRLFETHALLPRLGFFERAPHRVPYDFDELLRAIAPRPALLHTPTRDRDANASEVDALIDRVRWARLVQHAPPTATRMGSAEVKVLVRWLEEEVAGVTPRVRDVR